MVFALKYLCARELMLAPQTIEKWHCDFDNNSFLSQFLGLFYCFKTKSITLYGEVYKAVWKPVFLPAHMHVQQLWSC